MPPRKPSANKRTPRGTVDDARKGPREEWEVDSISSMRQKGKTVQYLVRWKGCEDFNDTWEPSENLAGSAETVAKFEREFVEMQRKSKKEAQEKNKARVAEMKQLQAETSARVALALENMKKSPPQQRKNSSPWWKYFARLSSVTTSPEYYTAVCIVPDPSNHGEADGHAVNISNSTNGMEDYVKRKYKTLWLEMDKLIRPHKYQDPVDLSDVVPREAHFKVMAQAHRQDVDAELVQWLQDHDRKREMVTDAGFAAFVRKVQLHPGTYKLPCRKELTRAYARRGAKGRAYASDWITLVKSQGRKISIAGDIWSDGNISLLVILGYAIVAKEEPHQAKRIEECVLAVVSFSQVRHTGDEILQATRKELSAVGVDDLYSEVFRKCSDAGSNIKKGWNGFEGGNSTCVDHKIEREVLKYYDELEIGNVAADRNKLAGHLAHSLASQRALKESQKLFALPERKVVQSVKTRWRSEHDQARWYRQNEPALNDARYMVDGPPGFSEHMLTAVQFTINNEEEAGLRPLARMELALEPGTSVTISLVLPTIDACMAGLKRGEGIVMDGVLRAHDDLHEATQKGRAALLDGLTMAFDTHMDPDFLTTLQIAMVCDPRHKDFDLRAKAPAALRKFKKDAYAKAKCFYEMHYKPKADQDGAANGEEAKEAEEASEDEEHASAPSTCPPTSKRAKLDPSLTKSYAIDLASLLGRPSELEIRRPGDLHKKSEWQRYVDMAQIGVNQDVIKWWAAHEDEFPTISEMACQVLAVPACSGGVERIFSKAGRNFDKSQKSTCEEHFSDILFAMNLKLK